MTISNSPNSINVPDESLLESLMRSPRLAMWRAKIDAALDDEQRKRQHFYEVVTEYQKAEFINGEIIMHSPAKLQHIKSVGSLYKLMSTFVDSYSRGIVGQGKMLITLSRNDYEPDICYFGEGKANLFANKQMQFPPPDFVVEILSPSTAAIDRTTKFDDYAAHGVSEYWIIDPDAESVEQYGLKDGRYELVIKARTGTIASSAVKGFEIPIRAIFDKDENLKALRAILA